MARAYQKLIIFSDLVRRFIKREADPKYLFNFEKKVILQCPLPVFMETDLILINSSYVENY